MTQLPPSLALRFETIFSQEENKKLKHTFSLIKRPVTFRINLGVSNSEKVEAELEKNNIKYSRLLFPQNCYLLDSSFSERDLWSLNVYKKGCIYLQGISSQIPTQFFNKKSPKKILDACAAPGGKTSQLSALYPDGEIFAFEPSKIRYEKLCYNLKKLGCNNVTVIHDAIENISQHIPNINFFDIALIDAPCSSEGSLLLKDTKFLENWDISHIKKNYKRQKRLCDSVIPYLKENGEMIYSTCTIAPEENEGVIHYLLCNHKDLLLQPIYIPETPEIEIKKPLTKFEKYSFKKEISENCVRIIPNTFTEGFFMAKFIKKDSL